MSIYDYKVKTRNGEDFDLAKLKGKVILVVNTATGCGFTPQYEAIENLYEKYHTEGFEVLDFPCNQFGHQAPGDDNEIHEFCTAKYQTKFDQMKKLEVNGDGEDPLFAYIKANSPKETESKGMKERLAMKAVKKISKTFLKESDISWNFTKFLVDKNGKIVGRFSPTFDPKNFDSDIKKLLEA